jgi:zinc transporter ZupT
LLAEQEKFMKGDAFMSLYPIFLAIVTFFSTSVGGLFAAEYRASKALTAFAAGVLISVPLFDLLPGAFSLAIEAHMPLENVMYVTAVGFIFLYVLERYISVHRVCRSGECDNIRHPTAGMFGATELSIHSFMDGVAIGVGFQLAFHIGMIVALAVICHDFSDGLNTVTIMLNSGNTLRSSLRMLLLDACTPFLGVLSTFIIKIPEQYLVLLLPFFAGGFLYLGAGDLLPGAHEKNPSLSSLISSLGGFLLIYVLTLVVNA